MTRSRACPTCGTMQEFRKLDDDEKAAVRAKRGESHYVDDLWRCTAAGCLTYFRAGRLSDRDRLPESFVKEEAAAGE
ncbi:hypothetical protein [Streptomyces lanatus]|uniref:Uncharacterized protein n=1 Tax=Streptomyces lanatus TaxID=66900 RepID=A0ABV1XI87_9ACTN|nr:hypothetical protein [Streptomyces lanatus]GHG93249.1 hypothetical protein GCM10018780_15520 [Streptomyces lanatus]